MRIILALIFLLISSASEAQKFTIVKSCYDKDSLRQGQWEFKSKRETCIGFFKDNKMVDKWEYFDKKGRPKYIEYYSIKDSISVLDSTVEYKKGALYNGFSIQEQPYLNRKGNDYLCFVCGEVRYGKRDGKWIRFKYFSDHCNDEEIEYSNGKKNGYWRVYDDSCRLVFERNYINDIPNGRIIYCGKYLEDGFYSDYYTQDSTIGYYKNGVKDSVWITYHLDSLKEITHYKNGKENGASMRYFLCPYFNDSSKVSKVNYRNILLERSEYSDGKKCGVTEIYDYDGKLFGRIIYKDSGVIGKYFYKGKEWENYSINDGKLVSLIYKYWDDSAYHSQTGETIEINTDSFCNGNGKIFIKNFPVGMFLQKYIIPPYDIYNYTPPPKYRLLLGDEGYTGYFEFVGGRVKDGTYFFNGHFTRKTLKLVFRDNDIAESSLE